LNLLRLNDGEPPPAMDPQGSHEGDDAQLPLFEMPPADLPDPTPHLLPEIDEERATIVGRETFLVSLVLHIAIAVFIIANPDLINLGTPEVVLPPPKPQEVTMLYEPPPPRPKLQAPPEPAPPPPPLALPRAAGGPDSQIEEPRPLPPGQLTEPPKPEPPKDPLGSGDEKDLLARMDPIGIPDFPKAAPEPPKERPSLEKIPTPEPFPSQAQLQLPTLSPPSRGTDAMLREMAKQHADGTGRGLGAGGFGVPDAGDPRFSLPGPQILSDTMGVNFDPYLLRVYLIVQRNWYSVIPEIARLGRKGRAILQFRILKNGSVFELQLMDGSGTGSMDSAALSSIRLSNPFPPLPPEFPGEDILLSFGYYYNMQPDYSSRQ
jgi:TonB family protein